MSEQVTIRSARLTAVIGSKGAQLSSLVPPGGEDVMWSGDPAIWPWHAPNLFPLVGGLANDTLVHKGKQYPIKQHGFLRQSECTLVSAEPDSCAFQLTDSEETRAQYPFAFCLTLRYRIVDDRLDVALELSNPDDMPLYACIGLHPAFRWPLDGAAKTDHVVLFDQPEPASIRQLDGRLIGVKAHPTPVEGRVLHLKESLFDHDALIFDRLVSRRLVYGAPGGRAVEFNFPDFPDLGIWTKPGSTPFLCIEPWQGYASPVGFSGEFAEKPGVISVSPRQTRSFRYAIRPLSQMPELPA